MTAADDVQLDKMHPIISDAAISSAPPPPTVNIISPVDDQPPVDDQQVTIATSTVESTHTTSSYEPHPSDATMVINEETATDEPVNIDTGKDYVI